VANDLMSATLGELLETWEARKIFDRPWLDNVGSDVQIKKLTVEQLGSIALILIETEYGIKCPECVLPAEAIRILTERAIKKNIAIY